MFLVDLITGARPIFGYFMISYVFALLSGGFAMFLLDLNRRPSPDLRLSYDSYGFVWLSYGFAYVFG